MISRVISDLRTYQQKQYQLQVVHEIRQFLIDVLDEKQLLDDRESYRLSLICEPRGK